MASNIPVRRTTRSTRIATITTVKDSENPVDRPMRATSRVKPTAVPVLRRGATAPTVASRAKKENLVGKRKREALVEVTGLVSNNKNVKPKAIPGKEAEASKTTALKKPVAVAHTAVVEPPKKVATVKRLPSRTHVAVTTRQTRSATLTAPSQQNSHHVKEEYVEEVAVVAVEETVVEQPPSDHVMQVDPPAAHHPRVFTRKSIGESRLPTLAARHTEVASVRHEVVEDEAESRRIYKKRHTTTPEAPPPRLLEQDDESQIEADRVAAELAADDVEAVEVGVRARAEPVEVWDDLDAEDEDDPLMVSEYVGEVFNYLKELELKIIPNPAYMEAQAELDWHTRGVLIDWLIQVHARFRLLPESLFLCINIMDRFLSARVVSLSKFQLVGITCFFIAAKYEETMAPAVSEISFLTDSLYSVPEILKAERFVLKTLEWNLSYPNPLDYLRRFSKADDCELQARTVGKYLLEIGCMEWRLISTPPSLLAAAALWLARLCLGRENWTPNLIHYSSYTERELIPAATLMLNYIIAPIKHEAFYKKYASKRFFKASLYMRRWALEHWDEGAKVTLAQDLHALKMEIRVQREDARLLEDDDTDQYYV